MVDHTGFPKWAENRRTLIPISFGLGVILAGLLSAASLIAPQAIGRWISAFATALIPLWLITLALIIIGLRRLLLGPAGKQRIAPSKWLVSYILAALPICFAAICLIIGVTVGWVLDWRTTGTFIQALIALLLIAFVVSFGIKIALNAQLLLRYWSGR